MVPDMFTSFASWLQPTLLNQERIEGHKSSIRARLQGNFELKKMDVFGSASRNTAIRDLSDVDILVVLSRSEATWGSRTVNSGTLLKSVCGNLRERYKQTDVRRDNQAIVLPFANGERSIDVVPAIFSRFAGGHPVYWIADGQDGWMETSPSAHGKYLKDANRRSGDKLRKTTQFFKYWKRSRSASIPLSSIYLELFLASRRICEGPKSYSQILVEALKQLNKHECRRLDDPVGVAGTLYSSGSSTQWQKLNTAIDRAAERAIKARDAEQRGDHQEAVRHWGILFNCDFTLGRA